MKKPLTRLFLILFLVASCASNSYRNIKYQRNSTSVGSTEKTDISKHGNQESQVILDQPGKILAPVTRQNTTSEVEKNAEVQDMSSLSTEIPAENITQAKKVSNKNQPVSKVEEGEESSEPITKFATLSGIFGGLSFVPIVGWAFSILAITFGIIALYKIKRYPNEYGGRKKAVLGIILGGSALILGIALCVTLLIVFVL